MEIDVEMNIPQGTLAVDQTWTSGNNRAAVPYTVETITADITPLQDKPTWPLSSYGPAKHEPVIISGLDESPEELRLKAVGALKAGTTNEYTKYEEQKTSAAEQVYATARENVRELYEQALKVSTQGQASTSFSTPMSSAFGATSMPSTFGGANTASFGKPAFGQPAFGQTGFGSATSTSAFGQAAQGASAFGALAQPVSAFGQTAQTTPAFGQPTQPSPVFGKPSAFGVTTQPTSAFSQPSTSPVFGKPSQPASLFGQPSQPTTAFGQPSQPTSSLGQPSQPVSAFSQPSSQPTPSFGQSSQPAFGQSSLIKPPSGAFGGAAGGGFSAFASQPSTFTSAAPPGSLAAGVPTGQSAFGSTTTPSQSVFGSTPAVQSAFGSVPAPPKSAFGISQPPAFGTTSLGNAPSTLPSPGSAMSGPFATSPMTVTPSNEKPASGAPDFASAKTTVRMKPGVDPYLALLPNDYEDMMPAEIKAAFTGEKFEWGKIPDWIPPEGVR